MERLDEVVFRGKINRRLSLYFAFLFFLVLVAGAVSLYFSRSILLNTERIKKESEQEVLVDRIDDVFHHFVSSLEQAALQGTAISGTERLAYLQSLYTLLKRYHEASGVEEAVGVEVSEVIAGLASLSEKLTKQPEPASKLAGEWLNAQDLAALSDAERKIQAFNRWRSEIHRVRMEEEFKEDQQKMQFISVSYAAIVFTGGLFIIGSGFFFSRAIAKPLRRLVHEASKIANGNLDTKVPVTSMDEICELSHIFNFMVGRLREHEGKLRVLATIEERELVAQELHDSLAQDLAILRLKLVEAEKDFALDGGAAMKEVLTETRKTVERTYKDVRQAILGLHTVVSNSSGFVPSLTEYLHDFSEMSKIPVDFKVDRLKNIRFLPEVETQLIRIIHEALTNVFKHAQATRSTVEFKRDGDFIMTVIEDNGRGLVMDEGKRNGLRFGLQTMRKRAEGVGGKLSVETVVGKGTRVIVRLPSE